MTKSELIERVVGQHFHIHAKVIKNAVKEMLEYMIITLANGNRIEIRGFGSFSLHYRTERIGRNPKTGSEIKLEGRCIPYFKPGKELRNRTNICHQLHKSNRMTI